MTRLVPMLPDRYPAYLADSIAGYAADNVAVGRWPAEGAQERSRREFATLLPQGLATPDQHLFDILNDAGDPVGVLWLAIESRAGVRYAYVYDLAIDAAHRRQGHARNAFLAMEALVREWDLSHIGLHVFRDNGGAQALFASLGYQVTGLNMQKQLKRP